MKSYMRDLNLVIGFQDADTDHEGIADCYLGIEGVVFGLMELSGGNLGAWITDIIGCGLGGLLAAYPSIRALEVL